MTRFCGVPPLASGNYPITPGLAQPDATGGARGVGATMRQFLKSETTVGPREWPIQPWPSRSENLTRQLSGLVILVEMRARVQAKRLVSASTNCPISSQASIFPTLRGSVSGKI